MAIPVSGDEVDMSFNREPLSFETAIEISLLDGWLYYQLKLF